MPVICLLTLSFKKQVSCPFKQYRAHGYGFISVPSSLQSIFFFLFLENPNSSQKLFLRIILKRKHHVNCTVVVMAVLHCPSIELPPHTSQGVSQTWTHSLSLTVSYRFYFWTREANTQNWFWKVTKSGTGARKSEFQLHVVALSILSIICLCERC